MPCTSEGYQANSREIEGSRIVRLLDELEGKGAPNPYTFNNGMDNRIYNKSFDLDALTVELCGKLQKIKNIAKYSLELQIWWRNHQELDKKRLQKELAEKKEKKDKEKALAKLTPYERKVLGLK